MKNIFDLPEHLSAQQETSDALVEGNNIFIERIISTGQKTPEGRWYDQEKDEWVLLLQGRATLVFDDGKTLHLEAGDYMLIPQHTRHRVEETSADPPCVWLAVHARF